MIDLIALKENIFSPGLNDVRKNFFVLVYRIFGGILPGYFIT
jgi:hypothetical protein